MTPAPPDPPPPSSSRAAQTGDQVRLSDVDTTEERPRKKRKQRQRFSCGECRRLKLKCDRRGQDCFTTCSVTRYEGHVVVWADVADQQFHAQIVSGDLAETYAQTVHGPKVEHALEGLLEQHGITLPAETLAPGSQPTSQEPQRPTSTDPRPEPSSIAASNTIDSRPHLSSVTSSDNALASSSTQARSPKTNREQSDKKDTGPHLGPIEKGPSGPALSHLAEVAAQMDDERLPQPSPSTISDAGPIIPPAEIGHVRFDFDHPSTDAGGSSGHIPSGVRHMSPDTQSYGTLVLSQGGRSKYLGPTAASEWLKDQEYHEPMESPNISRMPSPERRWYSANEGHGTYPVPATATFPFGGVYAPMTTAALLSKLPPIEEGSVLVDSYYRYFAWHFDVAPRESFQRIFNRVYSHHHGAPVEGSSRVIPSELALVYVIFALGALHNLELPANDPSADEFCSLAKSCLVKGDFLTNNTVAGVQTLHIMSHYLLETEKGRNGDSAWPLWGLAMRLIQAMGLHRDGARWNLPPEVVEERRRVFWESYAADIFQANCFSRPASLPPDYVDTLFPLDLGPARGLSQEKGFFTLKFELSQISVAILDLAMKVSAPPYSTVSLLYQRLCEFERQVPYYLRCRAALLSIPSAYADPDKAIRDSPEVSKRNLTLTFQQYTLAINISEAILFLHRPYYARALHDELQDPTKSVFGPSYLAVVERCHVIISIVGSLYSIHPNVCARHWFLWYHAFNSAVCMGTLIFQNPQNALAGFALSQIDSTIGLYTSAVQGRTSRRMVNNLRWLLRLRAQADRKMGQVSQMDRSDSHTGSLSDREDDDIELIGWRTRLIERASLGKQTAKTISHVASAMSNSTESPSTDVNNTISQALQQLLGSGTGEEFRGQQSAVEPLNLNSGSMYQTSTNDLLHQFWDPMMLQEHPENAAQNVPSGNNWWDWDNALDSGGPGP